MWERSRLHNETLKQLESRPSGRFSFAEAPQTDAKCWAMDTYNKLVVGSELGVEAHHKFVGAKSDIDYISALLLSGAVVGIVHPLIAERGGKSSHDVLARVANLLSKPGEAKRTAGFYQT